MKNVVSLALFRHARSSYEDPRCGVSQGRYFANCLPAIVRGYAVCFPGWTVRIYHDDSIYYSQYGDVLFALAKAGAIELVDCGPAETLCGGMLWRMRPASDPEVSRFICRDVDAMPTPREAKAVQDWIDSGLAAHIIHDSSSHTGYMGGMMGFRADALREVVGPDSYATAVQFAADDGIDLNVHGGDQRVLNRLFKARLATSTLCSFDPSKLPHSEFRTSRPIPPSSGPLDMTTGSIGTPFDRVGAVAAYKQAAEASADVAGAIDPIESAERSLHLNDQAYGNPPPHRYVVTASNLSHDYAFYLPIVAAMWMELRYRPVFFLLGTSAEWKAHPFGRIALEESRLRGAAIHFVDRVDGYLESTVAQTVRLAGGLIPLLFDDDYVLTTDVDMLPLSRTFFDNLPGTPGRVDVLFANAYDEKRPHWPICYVGMTKLSWTHLLGSYASPHEAVSGWLNGNLSRTAPSMEAWCFDEYFVSEKIDERVRGGLWTINLRDRIKAPAGWPASRIDRAAWDQTWPENVAKVDGGYHVQPGAVDCHAPRPGYAEAWDSRVRPLLDAFSPGMGASFAAYADAFKRAASGGGS